MSDDLMGLPKDLQERLVEAKVLALESETSANRAKQYNDELEAAFRQRELAEREASNYDAQVFHFNQAITPDSVSYAIDDISRWARRVPNCDITVVLNSPGGGVFAGLSFFDFLRDLRAQGHKVITKTYGFAASMAGILLQAGDERVMGANSYLMIHEPAKMSFLDISKASELKDDAKRFEDMWNHGCRILAERATLTPQQIKAKANRKDWWLDPEEALKLGFIDRVE